LANSAWHIVAVGIGGVYKRVHMRNARRTCETWRCEASFSPIAPTFIFGVNNMSHNHHARLK
jgi:hypothetical protein